MLPLKSSQEKLKRKIQTEFKNKYLIEFEKQ